MNLKLSLLFSVGRAGRLSNTRSVVRSSAPLVYMSKCPWVRHYTPHCSWWLWHRCVWFSYVHVRKIDFFKATIKTCGNAAWNSKNAHVSKLSVSLSIHKSLGENKMLPTIRKPSSNSLFWGNSISPDCVGVADHVLIDSSLNPSFVNCLSSPRQPWSEAGNSPQNCKYITLVKFKDF